MSFFGVAVNPTNAVEWERLTGVGPDFLAVFENWSNARTLADQFAKARELGYRRYMITWEPWDSNGDRRLQPKYSADAILRGDHDEYIKAFAVAVRDSALDEVYIRFAHEMNGNWYPWGTQDPAKYVAAWVRVRLLFRQKNAFNAKWLWSPNADLYRDRVDWLKSVLPYWPGSSKVDYVGLTTINFGADKYYPWSLFAARLDLASYVFQKPVGSSEMNTNYGDRFEWFTDLTRSAESRIPNGLSFVCLSQGESYAEATLATGNLSWSVTTDDATHEYLKRLVETMHS